MKIVNTYLVSVSKQNGPDSYNIISKIVELENGSYYEVIESSITKYSKITKEQFNLYIERSKDI